MITLREIIEFLRETSNHIYALAAAVNCFHISNERRFEVASTKANKECRVEEDGFYANFSVA